MADLTISRVVSDLLKSNMYVVSDNGHALVIDPCRDTSILNGLEVDYLFVTHEHYDHISGVNAFKEVTGAPLLCSENCAKCCADPKKNLSRYFDAICEMQTWVDAAEASDVLADYYCMAEVTYTDKYELHWLNHFVEFIELPGHSAGSQGILIDNKHFFSGDSIIPGAQVELRFPGGSARNWETISKPRLMTLPSDIIVHPGHFDEFVLSDYLDRRQ